MLCAHMNTFSDSVTTALQLVLSGDPGLWAVVSRSLAVSAFACLVACGLGLVLGAWLAVSRFAGRGVVLTLLSTNTGTCPPVQDQLVLTFGNSSFAFAGADELVCANAPIVDLTANFSGGAQGVVWSSSGSGFFMVLIRPPCGKGPASAERGWRRADRVGCCRLRVRGLAAARAVLPWTCC